LERGIFKRLRFLVCEMIPKRKKSGSMFVLFLIVLCVVIHDVVGGPADRIERAATSSCGKSQIAKGLSVGGNNTKPHTWPWMVALQKKLPENKSEFFCAGSLITERHVVSGNESIPRYSIDSSSSLPSSCSLFHQKVLRCTDLAETSFRLGWQA
jgi:hypothetical protein